MVFNIKEILFSLLRSWWIIVLAVILTTVSTVFFGLQRDPVYQSSATVELAPSPALADSQMINIINVLTNRRTAINTYARKATSGTIKERVAEKLGVPLSVINAAGITAFVLPETTLIEIRAKANDAQLAADISNAVAEELILQVPDKVMIFEIIDFASPAGSPTEPQPNRLVTMGVATGLVLGLFFALALYALQLFLRSRQQAAREPASAVLASSTSK
jgi:capsular polysaccharide biosynthesis protein